MVEAVFTSRKRRAWVGILLFLPLAFAGALLILSAHLRGPIIRYAEGRWHRQIRVDGPFEAHLLSWHPRLVAEQVTIGNPSWMPPGVTARIGRLALTYDLPWSGHWEIRKLDLEGATLTLARDARGRANWQAVEPGRDSGSGPPPIHGFSMPAARVTLDDARRRLKFDGRITARERPGQTPDPVLEIEGQGQLNERPVSLTVTGDPLAPAKLGHPYGFEFSESSSASRLTGRGRFAEPFDLLKLDVSFEAAGEDMKDLYYLAGVSLPDTGAYRLSGVFLRRGDHLEFRDLAASAGNSDVHGSVSVEARLDEPSIINMTLRSRRLRLGDLGAKAAGRAAAKPAQRMIPDTPVDLSGTRQLDADVAFHADALEVGRASLRGLEGRLRINRGVIEATPVSAALRDGRISGTLRVDATGDIPAADLDLRGTGLPLDLVAKQGTQAPMSGTLRARLTLKGRGRSTHGVLSQADGMLTAVLPHGSMRSSLAELAGMDFRGLGLMAAGSHEETPIRCAVAGFTLRKGTLTADRMVIDTEPVLISGEGSVDLGDESLDMRFHGRAKHPRLRVHAPVLVHGSLEHPQFSVGAGKPAAQAGGAVALGVLLTPVAAMLAFVDPGLAKDADCAALLAQARSGEK